MNFEKAQSQIFRKIINKKWNEEMLANVPHIIWKDLAMIYYIK